MMMMIPEVLVAPTAPDQVIHRIITLLEPLVRSTLLVLLICLITIMIMVVNPRSGWKLVTPRFTYPTRMISVGS